MAHNDKQERETPFHRNPAYPIISEIRKKELISQGFTFNTTSYVKSNPSTKKELEEQIQKLELKLNELSKRLGRSNDDKED